MIRLPKGGTRRVRCMLTYAHACSRVLTYAGVCSQVARDEYAVCSRMRTYAHECSRMLAYAHRWPATSMLPAHVC